MTHYGIDINSDGFGFFDIAVTTASGQRELYVLKRGSDGQWSIKPERSTNNLEKWLGAKRVSWFDALARALKWIESDLKTEFGRAL